MLTSLYRIFELFVSILDLLIQKARIEGNLDSGIVDMRANVVELRGSPKVYCFPYINYHFSVCFFIYRYKFFFINFLLLTKLISIILQTVHVDPVSGASTMLFTFSLDRGVTWEVPL